MIINNNIIDKGAIHIIEKFMKEGYEIYLVGGCVRDLVLGDIPKDWDMCTNAKPNEIKNVLKKHNIKSYDSGIQFGTITAQYDKYEYEITTYRKETGYADSRHPDSIEYVDDIHYDLLRRDLTINALAYNPINCSIIDDFGGLDDLNNGIIRAVGNPADRFREDGLRLLRTIRFAIKYHFEIEADTSAAIKKYSYIINDVSKERVTDELFKILKLNKPVKKLFTDYSDIICKIFQQIKPCVNFNQNNKYHKHSVYEHCLYVTDYCDTTDPIIKLAGLLHDIGKPKAYVVDDDGHGHFYGHPEVSWEICKDIVEKQLKLTCEEKERLLFLVRYHDMYFDITPASVKRKLNKFNESYLRDWAVLKQADIDDHIFPSGKEGWAIDTKEFIKVLQQVIDEKQCFSLKQLKFNGGDLMKLTGCKPGKHIGIILNTLLEEVINNTIDNETDKLEARALELFNEIQSN